MFSKVLSKGKEILIAPQVTILSAASVIMLMVVISQVIGVLRQRVLLHFFSPTQLALFLAAFRLPDLVFEVLAFGAFSSAFIPVFSKTFKSDKDKSWEAAARIVNLGLVFFISLALFFSLLAKHFYVVAAPGFSEKEVVTIARLARVLFAAQGLFVLSYVMTGVLESLHRFLVPALAPIFYNLGIIMGTVFLFPRFGLMAPAIGVLIGAFCHFAIQFPLAYKLGFRFRFSIGPNREVKLIFKLAAPRILELSFLQIQKTAELFFASLISTASYTYLNLANSLQLVPISLFGVSLSKAAFPTLTRQEDDQKFGRIFLDTLYQMMFIVLPIATVLIVLRVPLVRLLYGTGIFDWKATVQTGLVLSSYAIGVPFQAALTLLSRAFYARHETRIPVVVAILDVIITIAIEVPLIMIFHLPAWSLGFANSVSCAIQVLVLYYLLSRRVNGVFLFKVQPIFKSITASFASGIVMFAILKFFDRSVWVKRLSFLASIDTLRSLDFERFVIDTRYTFNLMFLVAVTLFLGGAVYLLVSILLKSEELTNFVRVIRRRSLEAPGHKELEPLTTEEIV